MKTHRHCTCDGSACYVTVQSLEIFASLRRELTREGHLRPPHIFLHPSLPAEDLPRLQRTVEQLGGEVAASEGARSLQALTVR